MSVSILKTIDRAAETLYEGFVSETLGWRGAVLFFVLLGGLFPFGSLVNALWIGLVLLANWSPNDFGWSFGEFYALCVGLILGGVLGVWLEVKEMAARPIANRLNPPWTNK